MEKGNNSRWIVFILKLFIITILIYWGFNKIIKIPNQHVFDFLLQNLEGETPSGSPSSLTLNGTSYDLKPKENYRLVVTANYSNGSSKKVTNESLFSTSNKKVAMVNTSGVISAVGSGFASITVKYEGETKTIPVSVSRNGKQVNVKDFGAKGDGIHDDTDAFQDAIDNLSKKGGGDVIIPIGTYILQPIFLKSKVNLVGENRDNVIIKLSDHAPDDYTRVINLINTSNTKIQNITCDGNNKNHPNGIEHMHCIFAWDSKKILIDNNRLINAVGDGISISGSSKTSNYVIISNNILKNNRRSNIVLEQVNNLEIFNNISTSNIGRPALHFEPWEEMSFYNAEIHDNSFISNTEGYCVQLEGGKDSGNFYHNVDFYDNTVNCPNGQFLVMETKDANIHHNTLDVSSVFVWIKNEDLKISKNKIDSKNGIVIEGTWGMLSKRTHISDNIINTSGYGVHIIAGARDTKIIRNKFTGSGVNGISFFASVKDITNTTVADNTFNNFEYGVFTDYDVYNDMRINGLLIRGNKFTNLREYALFIKGTTRNITFDNNIVKKASGVYISVEDRLMSNIKITNNIILGGKRGIIQRQYSNGALKGLIISENKISNTTDKGDNYLTGAAIELDRNSEPPTNVLIRNNVLTDNAQNFITVPDSLSRSVQNNIVGR
ncbi:right-handed parallel beta-helix repeat-containing protein [Neobacillus sp. LXY-4]|uniref:right-handed parallel beta-helix repeat-containing protein n=1 Tax=Neobacillus sp. LXY-4 TaxID=3379826 RepID=UPI003EE2F510